MTAIHLLAEALDEERGGGAERAIRATARALAKRAAVTVFAPADRLGAPEPGVELVGVALRARRRAARAEELARALPEAARARGGARLVACGKILGADLLWPHGGVHAAARLAAASAGRSGLGALVARAARALRPVERVFDRIERANAERARRGELRFLALSERVARDAREHLGVTASAVVRNGVERERFRPRAEHRERAVRALFCGHAFALKGLDRALHALALAPSARLDVVGRAPSARWKRLAEKLGVAARVRFLGAVPALAPLLERHADALLHPTRYDPCSLVVLEALAAGVPVIASREDGASELVGAGGFVLADADSAAEAGQRLEALADPETRRACSEAALGAARSTDQVAAELLALAD